MVISEARLEYIKNQAQKIARNRDVSRLVRAMRINGHLSNTSAINAFGLGLIIHGGGFFYLYKILFGVLCAIPGYTIAVILIKTCVCSVLACFFDSFEKNWELAKWLIALDLLLHVTAAIVAAIVAPQVRAEAQFWLDSVPRETNSSDAIGLLDKIKHKEV